MGPLVVSVVEEKPWRLGELLVWLSSLTVEAMLPCVVVVTRNGGGLCPHYKDAAYVEGASAIPLKVRVGYALFDPFNEIPEFLKTYRSIWRWSLLKSDKCSQE